MPQTKRRRIRKPSNLGHACRLEALEGRRLLTINIDDDPYGIAHWGGAPIAIAPNATIVGAPGQIMNGIILDYDASGFGMFGHFNEIVLAANVSGTNVVAQFSYGVVLSLSGNDTLAHYQNVLRSVTYHNTDPGAYGPASGRVFIDDGGEVAEVAVVEHFVVAGDATTTKSDESTQMQFTIDLAPALPSDVPITVHYATHDGTAIAGVDYATTSGTVTFEPGQTTRTVNVPILPKHTLPWQFDADAIFTLELYDATNAVITPRADGTLTSLPGRFPRIAKGFIFDSVITNPLPDALAVLSVDSYDGGVSVFSSAVTGHGAATVPTITGPLADRAGIVSSTIIQQAPAISMSATFPLSSQGDTGFRAYLDATVGIPSTQYANWGAGQFKPRGTPYESDSEVDAGSLFRIGTFAALPSTAIAPNVRGGTYAWQLVVSYYFGVGIPAPYTPPDAVVSYHGTQSHLNFYYNNPYGAGRWIQGLDQLLIQAQAEYTEYPPYTAEPKMLVKPQGVTYIQDDGTAIFFAYSATTGQYIRPRGYFFDLQQDGAGYTAILADGTRKYFSAAGLLTRVVYIGGDEVSYQYNPDKTVASISDSAQHAIHFGYTDNRLTSITDAASRVTSYSNGTIIGPAPEPGQVRPQTTTGGVIQLPSGELLSLADAKSFPFGSPIVGRAFIAGQAMYQFDAADSYGFMSQVGSPFATDADASATIYQPSVSSVSAQMDVDDRGWVINYRDFAGNTTEYERDNNGLVTEVTLPGHTTPQFIFTYDEWGRVRTKTSKGTDLLPDAIETWDYDEQWGTLERYEDAYGNATIFGINSTNGQIEDVYQRSAEEENAHPKVELFTELFFTSAGNGIPAGLPDKTVGPNSVNGVRVITEYDYSVVNGELRQTVTDGYGTPESVQRTFVFDQATMNLKRVVDERLQETSYEYNALGQLRRITEPPPDAQTPSPEWVYSYDSKGLLESIEDPRHTKSKYVYHFSFDRGGGLLYVDVLNASGNPVEEREYRWYDSMGRLSQYGNGNKYTNYQYDDNGNLTETKLPALADGTRPTSTYHYNNQNLLDWSRDPNLKTTNYQYDNRGQLTSVLAPAGTDGVRPNTLYSYDQRGFQIGIQDPMGRESSYEYDILGRTTRVTEPNPGTGHAAATTAYKFNNIGNTVLVTSGAGSPLARTTEYVYDELNRLTFVKQPPPQLGGQQPTTKYTYYDTGELNTLTDPNNNTTTWGIDNLGRATTESIVVDAVTKTRTFHYDAIGNLDLLTDRQGRVTRYSYDALNRMTDETWFQSATQLQSNSPERTLSYRYNTAGDLTSAFDPSASYSFTPDALGRTVSTGVTLPGLTSSVSLTNHYDAAGNRDSLTASIGGVQDFVNTYAYDGLNRLASVKQTGAAVATKQVGFQYNLTGQLTHLNRFDHAVQNPADPTEALASTAYGYDGAGRVNSIGHTASLANPIQLAWVYDAQNRVQQFRNTSDMPLAAFYGYDANNQLLATTGGSPETYDYDAGGNRVLANGVTSTPDDANRLQSDGRYNYTYDAEGNLVNRTETATGWVLNLEWDHRNRLTDVREWKNGQPHVVYELEYEYDVFDRRVARKETTYQFADGGEGGSHVVGTEFSGEKFIYDGDHIVYDFASTDGTNYALSKRYLYGPAVDQLLAQENVSELITDPDRVYWMLADNQGTIRDIVDNDGGLVQHYKYSAYGQLLSGNTSLTRYLYTGRELDQTTGLQYNRGRWYDSRIGRFLSEDPSGFGGGDTNLYRYTGNSPTNATDPSGMWADWITPVQNSPTLVQAVPRYRNHQIVGGMGGTNGAGRPFTTNDLAILAAFGGIFIEPLDWIATGYEIWHDPWSGLSYAGLIPFIPAAAGSAGKGIYQIGRASDLRKASIVDTSIHHVPQTREAELLVGDFNVRNRAGNEIGVRLPNSEHAAISAAQAMRTAPMSARGLLASDVRLLRLHTSMSNTELQKLIRLIEDAHPSDFAPLHRPR